jgi:hypothetical protein
MDEYCTYCGASRGDRISCCGEVHFMSAKEFKDYHGEWPDDGGAEESDYYDELNRGYAKDRL